LKFLAAFKITFFHLSAPEITPCGAFAYQPPAAVRWYSKVDQNRAFALATHFGLPCLAGRQPVMAG